MISPSGRKFDGQLFETPKDKGSDCGYITPEMRRWDCGSVQTV